MDELIIRKAEEKDITAIAFLEKQCFASPWSYESLYHDIMENKLALYIVAETEGVLCGYMGIWNIVDEGHITNVAVSPLFRGKHVGTAMVSAMIDVTEKAGIKKHTLEVRESNSAAIGLYKKMGFETAGKREGYYEDNGEDALIMWREEK